MVLTGDSSNPTDVAGSLFCALIVCAFDLAAAQFVTQPFQPECSKSFPSNSGSRQAQLKGLQLLLFHHFAWLGN